MRRTSPRKTLVSVSLFPFLAVLICTMGAMIVLLVLVVQQARVQADTISEQRAEDRVEQQEQQRARQQRLQQEEEDFRWQQEILEQQRRELTERLGERRLELSHLEDHIQRLEQRWKQLQAEAAEAERNRELRQEDLVAAQQERDRLQAEIEAKQAELAAAREALKRRKPAYSIIPYDGPHGTRRRPIYVECRETAIILQPENVVLRPDDFAGPLGPGNPLDAALRAIREYWARVEGGAARGEPYPLLIVRPDGAVAYSMARAAMANWEDEFGYELVEADVQLSFPRPDPQLAQHLEATIAAARQRQSLLAAAMPSRFAGPRPEGFRLSDRDAAGDFSISAEGYGPGEGQGPGGNHPPGTGLGSGGGRQRQGASPGSAALAEGFSPGAGPAGGGGSWPAAGGPPGFYQAVHGTSSTDGTPAGGSAASGSSSATTGAAAGGSQQPGSGPGGGQATGTARPVGGSSGQGTTAGGQAGPSLAAGGSVTSVQAGGGAAADGAAAVQSIAQQKGANWALPNVAARSTGITRPIAVECYPDRLVILPDRGDSSQPQVVSMNGPTQRSMQEFVSGVWTHMERWGMAVAGGYWKPVLRVRVAPGAENRFDELNVLLQDSGIEVEKR